MSAFDCRVVVFDWDGTLVDSTGAIAGAIRAAAADLGLAVPTPRLASHVIGLGLSDALRQAVPDLPVDRTKAFIERYREHFFARNPHLRPFDGITDLLDTLGQRDAWLAVATGKSRAGLDRSLERLGWRGRFITTRTADEGAPKPDPWMLLDICAELGVAASEALMVGDTTHDLGMAESAGARAIAVSYGAHPRDALASFPSLAIADSVEALSEALLRIVR